MRRDYFELAVYALVMATGAIVLWQVTPLENRMPGDVGPAFFPGLMAWSMIGLAVAGVIRTLSSLGGDLMEWPGATKILVTLVATVGLLLLWQSFGYFFPLAFIYLCGCLFFFFSDGSVTQRLVLNVVGVSGLFTVSAWYFFTEILYTKF